MGHPLAVDSLLDSGATGMFIDVEYVRIQKNSRHTPYYMSYPFATLMEHPMKQA